MAGPSPASPAAAPRRAAHFGRCALLPDDEFVDVHAYSDAALAEHFNVPLVQIAEKRLDLLTVCVDLRLL